MPILEFGKYKNLEISKVWDENKSYCQWIYKQPSIQQYPEIFKFLDEHLKNKNDYYMTFGKYKNKPLSYIIEHDKKYILYLKGNEYVKEKLTKLYDIVNKIDI